MKQYKSLQGGQAVIMSNVSEEQHLNSNIITINSNHQTNKEQSTTSKCKKSINI